MRTFLLALVTVLTLALLSGTASAATCTTTVSTLSAAATAVTNAAPGSTVCLANGTYGSAAFAQSKAAPGVTVTAANPGSVTLGNVALTGTNITVSQVTMGSASLRGTNNGVTDSNINSGASIIGSPTAQATGDFLKRNLITHPTGSGEKDTVQAQWARGLVMADNKLVLADEDGGHNDGFQAFWSLRGATFTGNWFTGGLGAQGFFLKDFFTDSGSGTVGDCTNVVFADNLLADRANNAANNAGAPLQVNQCKPNSADPLYTGRGFDMQHNTIYANPNAAYLRSETGAPSGVYVHLNVIDAWSKGNEVTASTVAALDQDSNVLGGGSIGRRGPNDVAGPPQFRNRAGGDYRLVAGSPGDFGAAGTAGVDWKVGDKLYGPQAAAPPADTTPPQTTITNAPQDGEATSALVAFNADEPSSFECKLDAAAYVACISPWQMSSLSAGSHTVSVRATDTAGNVDPTPATATWTVSSAPPADGDGDGVPDSADACPALAGSRSDGCPSASETIALNDRLTSADSTIAARDASIVSLTAQLDALTSKLSQIHSISAP